MFARVSEQRLSVVEGCAAAIRDAILAGGLVAGQRLPPERELASQLGVNRITLRTALSRLVESGLVRVKHGSGYTVQPYRDTGGPALLPALVRLSSEDPARRVELFADLLLIRRHLAAAALIKICARPALATEPIAAAVGSFCTLARRGAPTAALARADLTVVAAILEATGSDAFRLVLNPLSAALDELPDLRELLYRQPADNAAAYEALLAWLARPSPDAVPVLVATLEARDADTIAQMRAGLVSEPASAPSDSKPRPRSPRSPRQSRRVRRARKPRRKKR